MYINLSAHMKYCTEYKQKRWLPIKISVQSTASVTVDVARFINLVSLILVCAPVKQCVYKQAHSCECARFA